MKVVYPYMGTSYFAFKFFLEKLGHEVVVKKPTNRTLSLGVQYAPEFACIPYKIILGTYMEAMEEGAQLIVTSGGYGPCRAGEYGLLHEKILKEVLGYDFQIIVFESLSSHFKDFKGKMRFLAGPHRSWWEIYQIFRVTWAKLKYLEDLEQLSHWIRPRELHQGHTSKALDQGILLIDQANTVEQVKEAWEKGKGILKGVSHDPERPVLKIGTIGEIYVVIEPFANLEIERHLGRLGVEVERSIYLTGWTKEKSIFIPYKENARGAAKGYLDQLIGGHGQESVGHTVIYGKENFHGVIHLAPFTCIPEIVAKSILPQVSRDYQIPVMTLFLDENTGQAGTLTRLEAFVDMLWKKQERLGVVS